MQFLTDYLCNKLIDLIFRDQPYSFPANLEFALFTTKPERDGTGTEVAGGGYSRVPVQRSLIKFAGTQEAASVDVSTGDSGKTSNNVTIEWPLPAGDWGNVGWVAVFDAHTDGNMLMFSKLATTKNIKAGYAAPKIRAGKFKFTLDYEWQ